VPRPVCGLAIAKHTLWVRALSFGSADRAWPGGRGVRSPG
jgi:hypothetical protein